ncbi:Far1 [Hordeum vulgare]|nr:Far1 [Hordeum vulgare]
MAPVGKQKPEGHGPGPASPLLDCALSKDADLVPVLPWTAAESSEHGQTQIWPGAIEERLAPGADANSRLEDTKGFPEKTSAWSSMKLSDPRVVPVLERFSRDINAKRMNGGMIVKEFLAQRLAPLQAHSRPLWEYRAGDDELRLRYRDLRLEDLSRVLAILLGVDPGDLPEALGGSEKTVDDRAVSVPLPSQFVLLRELEDDDATDDTIAGTPLRPARASRGLVLTPRTMRSACMHASRKLGAELSSAHPTSTGETSKAPSSPSSVGGPVSFVVAGAEKRKRWHDVEEQGRSQEEELKARETKLAAREEELSRKASRLDTKEVHLEERKKDVTMRKALLEVQKKALAAAEKRKAAELACFPDIELGLRKALRSLCRDEFDEPMATPEDGFATLAKGLIAALEAAVMQMDKILDSQCRDLFFAAATRVFSHLHLRDLGFDLTSVIVPVPAEARDCAAEAVKGPVEALVRRFVRVVPPLSPGSPPLMVNGTSLTLEHVMQRLDAIENKIATVELIEGLDRKIHNQITQYGSEVGTVLKNLREKEPIVNDSSRIEKLEDVITNLGSTFAAVQNTPNLTLKKTVKSIFVPKASGESSSKDEDLKMINDHTTYGLSTKDDYT